MRPTLVRVNPQAVLSRTPMPRTRIAAYVRTVLRPVGLRVESAPTPLQTALP